MQLSNDGGYVRSVCIEMPCVLDVVGVLASLVVGRQTGNESNLIYQGSDTFRKSSVELVLFVIVTYDIWRVGYNSFLTPSVTIGSIVTVPSLLWRCWLDRRKGIRPVKKRSDEVLAWLSVWREVQMICIWFSWCHCHLIISSFSKTQNGLPFWCRLTQVILKKAVKWM